FSLEQIFELAPEPFKSAGRSGIALEDGGNGGPWVATVLANKLGNIIVAGKIDPPQLCESGGGAGTAIDFARGELWLNGDAGATTGTRVRLNDPQGVYSSQPASFQTGPGHNGSADLRCQTDPDNPVVASFTGYPMRIPRVDPSSLDDPLCPR